MKILAVDDEKGALQLLQDELAIAKPDAQVFAFRKSVEALEFCRTTEVDVAFLDIQMREMTGLELALELKKLLPKINIVFVTSYEEYMQKALHMHASGYVTKPVDAEDIREQLENLLYPVEQVPHIEIRCFGNFDLMVDGKPVVFARAKAKELLAYLVDRRGSSVTKKELCAILFEDEDYSIRQQNYFTKILGSLRQTMEQIDAMQLLIFSRNMFAVKPEQEGVVCDAWEFLKGNARYLSQYHGEYMNQYSWAEESLGSFERRK